jgi:hypothetical protein
LSAFYFGDPLLPVIVADPIVLLLWASACLLFPSAAVVEMILPLSDASWLFMFSWCRSGSIS